MSQREEETALERSLGLYAVITISVGGMIGGGIFVLPGLAAELAGPSVMLAYLLAGLLVLPAALSKSEMATAMPESGGTYLFIDRAMGPLMGTIAGFGVWFSLVFKAAFALVGLGAYLNLLVDLPTRPVALAVAIALVVVNLLGTKGTGRLQAVIVSVVIAVLCFFVADGLFSVEVEAFTPFLAEGPGGLLAATGLVFVSYSGVTKVASVAEEIRRPGRTIPLGILSSIVFMMLLYTAIAAVVVGVVPSGRLGDGLTPIADAAGQFLGPVGVRVLALTAVLALISMANAGLLSASRYPFAMGRDSLLPGVFETVHPRLRSPIVAVAVTGGLLAFLVAFVPVIDLAKLASAFQILVFALVNVALIAFRQSHMVRYDPEFRSPVYPWVQVVGLVGGLVLLTQMGAESVIGAVLIVGVGIVLYRGYGRARTVREGAALDVLRRRAHGRFATLTERTLHARPRRVLAVVRASADEGGERALVRLARQLSGGRRDPVQLLRLDSADDGHQAVIDHVNRHDVDLLLSAVDGQPTEEFGFFTDDVQGLLDRVGCDTVFVRAQEHLDSVSQLVVMGSGGPYDALKVTLANRIAVEADATIGFVHVEEMSASDAQLASIRGYHGRLADLTAVRTSSVVERAEDRLARLQELAADADLVVLGASDHGSHTDHELTALVSRVAEGTDGPMLIVHAADSHRHSYLGRFLQRRLYGSDVGGRGRR